MTDPAHRLRPGDADRDAQQPGQEPLAWLKGGEQYRIVLDVPNNEGGGASGLRAIDGATLSAPMTILFTAGAAAEPPFDGIPQMQFCRDVLTPVFMKLVRVRRLPRHPPIERWETLRRRGERRSDWTSRASAARRATAVGQVADESNTGPAATSGSWGPCPFGVDMPIIDPTAPGNSWLIYKTLLAIPSAPDAAAADNAPGASFSSYGAGMTSPVSAAERQRLSNYILGNSMPYPAPAAAEPSTSTLSQADLIRLSTWIAQGAPVPTPPAPDA